MSLGANIFGEMSEIAYVVTEERGGGESGANAIEKFAHKATPPIAFHRSIVNLTEPRGLSFARQWSAGASHVPYFHKRNG